MIEIETGGQLKEILAESIIIMMNIWKINDLSKIKTDTMIKIKIKIKILIQT